MQGMEELGLIVVLLAAVCPEKVVGKASGCRRRCPLLLESSPQGKVPPASGPSSGFLDRQVG